MAGRELNLLLAASLRHLRAHPAQLALALLGLALGVATLTAVDISTASAARAFELSLDAANGAATHQIVGGAQGVDEQLYVQLTRRGLALELAPLVEGYVSAGARTLQLLGTDPLIDARVRGRASALSLQGSMGNAIRFLTEPGGVLLTRATLRELALAPGAHFAIQVDGREYQAQVLAALDDSHGAGFDGLLLADISQAQSWLGLRGRLSRIDVRVPAGARGKRALAQLRATLPAQVSLEETGRRAQQSLDMSRAFTINLRAMGLLALLVSVFLIYSAVSFAMLQRRALFGVLRALGATRGNLFGIALTEALALGVLGTALGIVLGIAIARELVLLVSRTINDLYFVVAVNQVALPGETLIKAILGGLCVTLIAAALPLIEVTGSAPQLGLRRSVLELRSQRAARWLLGLAIVLALIAGIIVLSSNRSLYAGFAALTALLLAIAAVAPAALAASARALARVLAPYSAVARIALEGIAGSLSRTGVAVASLAMAVAAMIGVAIMVGSFRESLRSWLAHTLQADVYVSAPGPGFARPERRLRPQLIATLLAVPGIADHSAARRINIESRRGPLVLDAVELARTAANPYQIVDGSPAQVWRQFAAGQLVISEPLAWRWAVRRGASVDLMTPQGLRAFRVAGIYREYGSDRGNALVSRAVYRRVWGDEDLTALGLYVAHGTDARLVTARLQVAAAAQQSVLIRSSSELRKFSMGIFERTFIITRVLNWLAAGVAAIALMSALLAWQLERSGELAILRALGLTPRGAALLIESQTLFMGAMTFLAALPAGVLTALLLIEVINRRAFGWQIQLHAGAAQFTNALWLTLAASLLAGAYPALRAARLGPAAQMRAE